jgi:hypothetical protein
MANLRAPNEDSDTPEGASPSALYRLMATPWVGRSIVLAAVVVLALFGVLGVFRATSAFRLRPDTRVLYVAGRMWLNGHNPYRASEFLPTSDAIFGLDDHDFMASGFGYLPTAWPLCGLLALWEPTPAFFFTMALNLVAVGAVALYAFRLASARLPDGPLRESLCYFVFALVIGSPFTTHIVFQGQSTMVATAALVAGWYYTFVRPRPNVAGILFAISTMKLQLALFAIGGLVVTRRWRVLLTAAVAGLVLVAYPVVVAGGPVALVRDWLAEVHVYSLIPSNAVGYPNVFGLQSLLVAAGVPAPSLGLLAIPLLAAVWWFLDRIEPDELLAILVASSCLLVYAHDYDLAALAPIHGCLWKRAGRNRVSLLGLIGFYVAVFAPQREFRGQVSPVLLHWRELAVLAAVTWLFVAAIRRGPRKAGGAGSLGDGDRVVQA